MLIMYKIQNCITKSENTITKIRYSGVPRESDRINNHTEHRTFVECIPPYTNTITASSLKITIRPIVSLSS